MKRLFSNQCLSSSIHFLLFQMININSLEERLLQLYKQRTDMIVTRRQEDVKDQCMEYSTSKF
jgi:hypothetical protein